MHEPYVNRLIEAVEAGIRLSLGRNLWMSRNPSATPSKMRTIRLIVALPSRESGLEAGQSDVRRLGV